MGLTLLETDQDLCPGWLSPVPPDLVSPQESSSPGPPTPRVVVRFPATQILPITLLLCLLFILSLLNQLSIEKGSLTGGCKTFDSPNLGIKSNGNFLNSILRISFYPFNGLLVVEYPNQSTSGTLICCENAYTLIIWLNYHFQILFED